MCAKVAAAIVQGMVPDTCHVVVADRETPRRRRRVDNPMPSQDAGASSTGTVLAVTNSFPAMLSEREALEMTVHGEVLTSSPERMRHDSDLLPNNTKESSIVRDTFLETLTDGFFGTHYGSLDNIKEPTHTLCPSC